MTKKKYVIEDFSILSPKIGEDICYNFAANKKLNNSCGVIECLFPYSNPPRKVTPVDKINQIKKLLYFYQYYPKLKRTIHRIMVYGDDTRLYTHQMFSGDYFTYPLYSLYFEKTPTLLSYRYNDNDSVIIASEDNVIVWKTDVTPYKLDNAPAVTSMCINEGVLFCTMLYPNYKIWYNKDLNLEKVGEESGTSGYISLDMDLGYANKVITFKDFVFIFRDYGISKITMYKDEIVVNEVCKINSRILGNTISVCGNLVVFFTNEGMYYFDGTKISKCNINLSGMSPVFDNAYASSLGENYYLALKLDFGDENKILNENNDYTNNAILIFNVKDKIYQIIRGVDVCSLCPVKTDKFEKMLVVFNTGKPRTIGEVVNNSVYYEQNLPKYWKKKNLFNDCTSKLITKLSVVCEQGIEFVLTIDDVKYSFTTTKNGANQFCLKRKCNNLSLEIISANSSAKVEKVEIEYYDC